MKPNHLKKKFSANRQFTDREDARDLFLKSLQNAQSIEKYWILG